MEAEKAADIIGALADGVNPLTGEEFPKDSVYNNPEIIRAMFAAAEALKQEGLREARRRNRKLPPNAGQPWSPEEDEKLAAMFDRGATIQQLAQSHQRTRGAIAARLERLGKIQDRSQVDVRNETRGNSTELAP